MSRASISVEVHASGTVDQVAAAVLAKMAILLSTTGTITAEQIAQIAADVERELS